ncbi:MAG: amidohydrolase [Chloroflexi bacterium]|nr:amidohydrolase [Chloroflexota bacterium]MCI0580203.1 amidohydrolase [Chloroflexota bacterium]MCI0646029.1 amidohydrolase [Chloroflexota bacterium]MCI0727371.1 amidohydrolase [Chloroflexota bacterium]
MSATLVLTNGRIHTQDPTHPVASAVAIAGDKILAVGDDTAMKALLGPGGEWLDLAGRCIIPGLVDAHVHFESYALALQRVRLDGAASLTEALDLVAQHAAGRDPGDWLRGRGWNQNDWPGGAFPTAADLDRVVPDRPVFLSHKSGHAAWANSRALRLAGITAATPDPPGGQIQREPAGQPTGILFEDAIGLVADHIPQPTESQLVAAMRLAQQRCWQAGLTGIHDFDGRDCFRALQYLHLNGELGLRVVKNIPVARLEYAVGVGLRTGFGDDWLRIGGVKIFADGALGPRTAAMIAPYEGEPDNRGIVVTDKEEMFAWAVQASTNGLSVTVHAIGDRANHNVLDVYEALRTEEQKWPADSDRPAWPVQRRHRIEHAQILHPDDFSRFSQLGVIASMQPIHATSDMDMANRYWGERSQHSYAWRTMLNAGATLVLGSDAPVDPIEPLPGIYAAVARRRPDGSPGPEGWYPEQRLTMAEAVQAFTMGAAVTSGREQRMGSITSGKLADLTILDRDIFAIPPDELLEVNVAGTIVGGRFMYRP